MDLLIQNATVVTMNAQRDVHARADVLVRDGRIAKVGRFSTSALRQVVDGSGMALLPGFIHGHLHACQTLFRNRADGLELLDWLRERIWPFEAAHDRKSLRASAELTFAELIRSGSTAALDMGTVHHTEVIFEAARDAGFRLTGGKAMMDHGQAVPAGLRETTRASIDESVALLRAFHGEAGGRLQYAFAPRFVLSCTEELLRQVGELARTHKARIHTHASENSTECDLVRQRFGKDNVEYFHALGMLGPHTTLAHCVWLTAQEHRLLRETQTVVCHCPSSNLKLASGIAKVPELLAEKIHVCLGADGAPCNNNLDMFTEMRLAALLHKPRGGPLAMPAMDVLEMATLGGARAIGQQDVLGSIEVGKKADLQLVSLSGSHAQPASDDVVAQLVYSCRADDVRHVFIDGRQVLRDRELLTLDGDAVVQVAAEQARLIANKVL